MTHASDMSRERPIDWRSFGPADTDVDEIASAFVNVASLSDLDDPDLSVMVLWKTIVSGTHDQVCAALTHPRVSAPMLLTLCSHHDDAARRSPDGATTWSDSGDRQRQRVTVPDVALRHPQMPAAVFDHLYDHGDANWRAAAVNNPRTPRAVIERLAADAHPRVIHEVVVNGPIDLVHGPFDHLDYRTLSAVARRDDLATRHLVALAHDPNTATRTVVASRPGLPEEVSAILRADRDRWVRETVDWHNPNSDDAGSPT